MKKKKNEEYKLEAECRRLAVERGCILAKIENNGYTGIPDDLFISRDGFICLIEFKNGKQGRLSEEQKVWLSRFPNIIYVIRSVDDFKEFLHKFD